MYRKDESDAGRGHEHTDAAPTTKVLGKLQRAWLDDA
jgi:hypothetical protein